MEELGNHQSEGINNPVKKKRSHTFRRPHPETLPASEIHDISSLSFTPPSDDACKVSSDENTGGDTKSIRKEINVNHYASSYPPVNGVEDEKPSKICKKEGVSLDVIYSNTDSKDSNGLNHKSSEGVLPPANWKSTSRTKENLESQPRFMSVNSRKSGAIKNISVESLDGSGNDKVKKVKLKVGGSTRTIDANSNSSKPPHSLDKLHDKEESDDYPTPQSAKRGGLKGVPWKDFSNGGFILGKKDSSMGKGPSRSRPGKPAEVRKSRRAPKKQVTDGAFYDDEDDDEIRYLEKLKNSRLSLVYRDDEEESGKKHRRLSNFSGNSDDLNDTSLQSGKDGKRKSPSEDTDYEEDEEPLSDDETGDKRKKKSKKEPVDSINEPKREFALTTRQRALQSGNKDAPASGGGSVVEFPNGLPPPPSRKQKEKLTDVELQLKKSEAAQRRKLQNEKAAKESEAEAIRKILGQDSNRKKREEKNKKRREELAQGKAADALLHASNTVRLTMGPNGTTISFPTEMGLPSLFNSKPASYPPPREKCAGPSCTNPYKYRDSRTNLPLCSLQCYKAVQALPAI